MSDQYLTLEQVLAITYTSEHRWAPAGATLAFIHDDGGWYTLRTVDARGGEVAQVSEGDGPVTSFAWTHGGRLAYIQGGGLVLATPSPGGVARWAHTELYRGAHPVEALAWAPRGGVCAFSAEGRLWTLDLDGPLLRELPVPGRVRALHHEPAICWAPDAARLAVTVADGDRWDLVVLAASGRILWRTRTESLEGPMAWLRSDRLLYAQPSVDYTIREWRVLHLSDDADAAGAADPAARLVWREEEPEGLGQAFPPQPHPDGRHAVLVLRHEGWWHLYLLDTESAALRALTGGDAEDVGHAMDGPRISPDGREVAFATNRADLGLRHLCLVDLRSGEIRQLTSGTCTSIEPEWSADGTIIAFRHSTARHAPELWAVERGGDGLRRLVSSMPAGIEAQRFPVPTPVRTRGAGEWEIPGYLLTPAPVAANRRYPALVYVHGGGMRQMRAGFPPLEPYAFFYAVSLWLAGRGVVSYLVNYRGGIGYGKAFEQGNSGVLAVDECEDCVRAGEYLKTLPFVDPARVGVWGLSYGGWLTLAALCRSPQTFALGINFAGLWDFDRWMTWAYRAYRPPYDYFLGRARGPRERSAAVWDAASPRRQVERMQAPLVNFHGTSDAAVPFEQLDLIVEDCVRCGKTFETHYYPGETHFFTKRETWRDALGKVEAALRRYLGMDGEPPGCRIGPVLRG